MGRVIKMDIGLFESPEKMIKIHARCEQCWRQLRNIKKRLCNPRVSEEVKVKLRIQEREAQQEINELNAKLCA